MENWVAAKFAKLETEVAALRRDLTEVQRCLLSGEGTPLALDIEQVEAEVKTVLLDPAPPARPVGAAPVVGSGETPEETDRRVKKAIARKRAEATTDVLWER